MQGAALCSADPLARDHDPAARRGGRAQSFGSRIAIEDGAVRLSFRAARRGSAPRGARVRGGGRRARRSRRDLGAESLGVDRRGARPAVGGRRAGAAQHALQGTRGRLRAAREPRAPAVHGRRVPRRALRRARCAAKRCPTLARIVLPARRGERRRRRRAGASSSRAGASVSDAAARERAASRRARRSLRPALHLRHDRRSRRA